MSDDEFRIACSLRLGYRLQGLSEASRCPDCSRNPLVGAQGEHFLHCPCGGDRISRHNQVRNSFQHLASMAGIRSIIEPVDFMFDGGRLSDLLLLNPSSVSSTGRNIAFDFSVTSPITETALRQHSNSATGSAANQAYQAKTAKYADFSYRNHLDFYPIIFETFGHCHEVASTWVSKLAAQAASKHSIPSSVLVAYWKRRFSVVLQRSTAAMVSRHIQRTLPRDQDFSSRPPDFFDDNR